MSVTWMSWMGEVPRASAPWNTEEDTRLQNVFTHGVALKQIAHDHGRSVGGIKSRLRGLIDDRRLQQMQRERLAGRGTYLGKVEGGVFQLFDAETLTPQEYCSRYGAYGGVSPQQRNDLLAEVGALRQKVNELAAKVESL